MNIPDSIPPATVADLTGFAQMLATNLEVNSKRATFRVACHFAREVERLKQDNESLRRTLSFKEE